MLAIWKKLILQGRIIVAIDGRCGSGKITLAARLQKDLRCAVYHMDDFFPRPEQRTEERLSQPGENADHERFLEEVLLPLHGTQPVTYRPFLCAQQQLGNPITEEPNRLTIVEGAYACHPELWEHYDLRVFLTIDPEDQMRRIEKRNGPEKAKQFRGRWIPFEEQYFKTFDAPSRCDMRIIGHFHSRQLIACKTPSQTIPFETGFCCVQLFCVKRSISGRKRWAIHRS